MTLEPRRRLGSAALGIMEGRLKDHDFLVGTGYSIADIDLHAYTRAAYRVGFDLGRFLAVCAPGRSKSPPNPGQIPTHKAKRSNGRPVPSR